MRDFGTAFLLSELQMIVLAVVALLVYAFRNAKSDFTWRTFVLSNRRRFGYGLIVVTTAALVLTIYPESRDVIGSVGFGAGGTDAALGYAIGSTLALAMEGNKV